MLVCVLDLQSPHGKDKSIGPLLAGSAPQGHAVNMRCFESSRVARPPWARVLCSRHASLLRQPHVDKPLPSSAPVLT